MLQRKHVTVARQCKHCVFECSLASACRRLQVFELPGMKQYVDRLPAETRAQTLEGIDLAVLLHQVSAPTPLYRVRKLAGVLHVNIVQHAATALLKTADCVSQRPGFMRQSDRSMLCTAQHPYVPVGDDSVWRYQGAAGGELARLEASAYGLVPDADGKDVLNGACSWAHPAA